MLLSIHHSMIITANHAISPPNRPYQKPVYKNGRWINASVAPTSFITTISSYLFKIFRRMVLPIISTTAMKSSNPISVTKSLAISITAYKRSNHSISSLPISIHAAVAVYLAVLCCRRRRVFRLALLALHRQWVFQIGDGIAQPDKC